MPCIVGCPLCINVVLNGSDLNVSSICSHPFLIKTDKILTLTQVFLVPPTVGPFSVQHSVIRSYCRMGLKVCGLFSDTRGGAAG